MMPAPGCAMSFFAGAGGGHSLSPPTSNLNTGLTYKRMHTMGLVHSRELQPGHEAAGMDGGEGREVSLPAPLPFSTPGFENLGYLVEYRRKHSDALEKKEGQLTRTGLAWECVYWGQLGRRPRVGGAGDVRDRAGLRKRPVWRMHPPAVRS
ncbi:hypothetical protein BDZ91DRAFT_764004 [Kalaharituber pfeilii]|nr:hypothetical protein BDZ91DRAFT_764004 [Kalaharituber pfeilii]